MIYACCDEHRRAAVLGNPALNGIDYLEVLDDEAPPGSPRQQTLLVHCLKPVPATLGPANIYIVGGESITGITALWVAPASAPPPQALPDEAHYFTALPDAASTLVIRTSVAGDFSPYCLRLVNEVTEAEQDSFAVTEALAGFDPILAEVEFSFKVECGPEFDCAPAAPDCPPDLPAPPPINYLAKDYGSFRTVLVDRLRQLLPDWAGNTEADLGVALAELLAYVGDNLSYHQDAVATEAYLLTARSRVSLRRLALLVDYSIHDGCNARAWVRLTVNAPVLLDRTVTRFYTIAPGMPVSLAVGAGNEAAALIAGVVVFQPMQDANLYVDHNQMQFYTWGDTDCCLPRGATEATLLGSYPDLQAGDVLIFQEMLGPQTGLAADADLRHRCAVRLTAVTATNSQGQPLVDPLFEQGSGAPITSAAQPPTPVTEIQWSASDALPFPVCISSTFSDSTGTEQTLTDVSTVFGNVVLADQGLTMSAVSLPVVPAPSLFIPAVQGDCCDPAAPSALPVRYWPALQESPVTQAVPLPLAGAPVTPTAVALLSYGYVGLTDASGFTALTVAADDPVGWPQYFGISVTPSAVTTGNIDLQVVYDPPGGPAGMTGRVVLEQFTDLDLAPGFANSVMTQLNGISRFVFVPSGYTPPTTLPTTFPAAPTMLPATGTVELEDSGGTGYLTLQPTSPMSWPPLFGVLAQGDIADPEKFNLVVVYQPPGGGNGVAVPAVAEQFTGVQLGTVAAETAAPSTLITVRSFEDEPNPALSASELMSYDADQAVPAVVLTGSYEGSLSTWFAVPDLLASGPADTSFVVEIDTDGTARLRFGDSVNGLFPESGTAFTAQYRVGNGTAGNVGAGSLIKFAGSPAIVACVNPMAASGGTDPETADQIRRRAPQAFETQERAITDADYAAAAEKASTLVEDAAATLRWTGSWYTEFVTAEPTSGGDLTPALRKTLTRYINRYRLAGQDIKVMGPDYVSLEIRLTVCVDPAYFRRDVEESLRDVLGSGMLPDGQPALFAPGSFVLGQTVYLSPIYKAARSVAGVLTVTADVFRPQGTAARTYLLRGAIPIGSTQVARMDNDPSLPDHGQLTLVLEGGK